MIKLDIINGINVLTFQSTDIFEVLKKACNEAPKGARYVGISPIGNTINDINEAIKVVKERHKYE